MKKIIIKGPNNTGKTGICNELIGTRDGILNLRPRKSKNKICVVEIDGYMCLIVSEGDNLSCIENIKDYVAKVIEQGISLDILIITVRDVKDSKLYYKAIDILNSLSKSKDSDIEIVNTKKLIGEDASVSYEYYEKAKEVRTKF